MRIEGDVVTVEAVASPLFLKGARTGLLAICETPMLG